MFKKIISLLLVIAITASIAVTGTVAYLQDEDGAVNVMTLGNVKIKQHEYERVVENGSFKTETIDNVTSYVLKDFSQDKPLYPATAVKDGKPFNSGAGGYDSTMVKMSQVGSQGGVQVFENANAVDKFVTVENTGKSDAYVRVLYAFEIGSVDEEDFKDLIEYCTFMVDDGVWSTNDIGVINIDGNKYIVYEDVYNGGAHLGGVHANGVLPAGKTTYAGLTQVYMKAEAKNEDVEALDGNGNGKYDILVLSQAIQVAGFESATAAFDAGFPKGTNNENVAEWFGGVIDEHRDIAKENPVVKYNGVEYSDIYDAVAAANENGGGEIIVLGSDELDKPVVINSNITIKYGGYARQAAAHTRADGYTGTMYTVKKDSTLTLENVVLDGGAVWSGEVNPVLLRGTENTGVIATGNIIATEGNGNIVLNSGTIIQNNDGANAISLATRGGGSLTVNGAYIINNCSAAGAIWGGDDITINEGSKINGNHATSIGGAIRMVNGNNAIVFTMNGGEMNNNYSDGTGGAIWGGNNAKYYLNGGEMAYNSAVSAGGAIWTGTYESYYISGDFEMHDNTAGELAGAIRFCDHASLTMTGGKVYSNTVNGASKAFYLNNNSASITGGVVEDNFGYSGGLGLTVGKADISGVINFDLGTNHNTAYLASEFNGFKFTVNEEKANFAAFNLKPAAGYTYTAGDEDKLVCLNEGYETYWDASTSTFKLQAE